MCRAPSYYQCITIFLKGAQAGVAATIFLIRLAFPVIQGGFNDISAVSSATHMLCRNIKKSPMQEDMNESKCDAHSAGHSPAELLDLAFSKAVIESIPGTFSITDETGRHIRWNARYRDSVVGKPESEMSTTYAIDFIHPDDRRLALEKMLSVLNNGTEETSEGRVLLRGGPEFEWRMITGRRIIIDGRPFIIAIGIEITERKRFEALTAFHLRLAEMPESSSAEELLRAALDEAERLTESKTGLFYFIDDDHTALSVQVPSTATQIMMRNAEEDGAVSIHISRTSLFRALQEQKIIIDNDPSVSPDIHGISDGRADMQRRMFIPLIRAGRVRAILEIGGKPCPYHDEEVKLVAQLADLVWDDVARRRAEFSEHKLQGELLQAQKMHLVGQLAGGISHEFNNMLGVIMGNVEIALSSQFIDEPLQNNLKDILKAVEHSAGLTRQLLAFARKQTVMPVVLDLNAIVEKMLTVLRRLIGEDIALVWIPERRRIPVKIDPSQIELILGNLCVNACDAIEGTGRITIETGIMNVDRADCASGHPCGKPGSYVTIVVSDTGCGIPKKNIAHIFEPFFTTKHNGKCKGMGLSTVYGIVKQNNATIDCQSEPGKGTLFTIYLPRYKGYADTDESDLPDQSIYRDKATILLVEDEPYIMNLCRMVLENKGFRVLAAATPGEAIRVAGEQSEKIHLLLTDVVLPEMNGCDLSKKLHAHYPDLKTLFMSGYPPNTIAHHGVLDEGIDFINKPFSIHALTGKVHEMLHAS